MQVLESMFLKDMFAPSSGCFAKLISFLILLQSLCTDTCLQTFFSPFLYITILNIVLSYGIQLQETENCCNMLVHYILKAVFHLSPVIGDIECL